MRLYKIYVGLYPRYKLAPIHHIYKKYSNIKKKYNL